MTDPENDSDSVKFNSTLKRMLATKPIPQEKAIARGKPGHPKIRRSSGEPKQRASSKDGAPSA